MINLFERGVVTGLPGNEFQPNGKLNRAQAACHVPKELYSSDANK
ncbi:S-layer homology domain-containing protein [Anaerobacillus sp. HL2]|nr:S-layer homology domain-containing protein [Anaerobacillus sp. HL2]